MKETKGCRYCDGMDNPKNVFYNEWPFFQLGKLFLLGTVHKGKLSVYCSSNETDPLFEFSQKINYCPMCGRRLTERKTE